MRLRRPVLLSLFLALTLLSCGRAPKSFDSVSVSDRDVLMPRTLRAQSVNATAAASHALQTRRNEQVVFLVAAANHAKEQPVAQREPSSDTIPTSPPVVSVAAAPSDLPPDWVIQRESGGDYYAYNPTGCADFCFGRYQFSSDWGGKLGLPEDIRQATPEQQDAAARELWANGAGCSHWSACG